MPGWRPGHGLARITAAAARPSTGRTGCGCSWSRRLRRSSPRCWRRRARTGTRARSRRLSRRGQPGNMPRTPAGWPHVSPAQAPRVRAGERETVLGRCSHPAGNPPGATSSMRADGVPQHRAWRAASVACPSGRGARLPVPGRGLGRLPEFAHPVYAHLDRFPVEHAVAAGDALPRAGGTRLGRGDRRLRAEAGQVVIGHEPRMAMDRRVRCAAGAEFPGRPWTSPGPGRQTQRRPGASRGPRALGPARLRRPRRCSCSQPC